MFYLEFFLVLVSLSIIEISVNRKHPLLRVMQTAVMIAFIFVAGLRYETGVDWLAYEWAFDRMMPLDEALRTDNLSKVFSTLDVGFSFLSSSVRMIGGNIQVLFFIISLISNILLLKNLRHYVKYVFLGYAVYYIFFFFIFDLSGMRQGLAIQIFFYGLRFIERGNFKKYLITILIATSIHWSSALLLPLYFIIRKPVSSKIAFAIFLIGTLLFALQVKWLSTLTGGLSDQLQSFSLLADKVNAYTTISNFAKNRSFDLFTLYNYVLIALIYIGSGIVLKDKKDKRIVIFRNLLICQFIITFLLYEFYEISERLKFYFLISVVYLIPVMVSSFSFRFYRQVATAFFIVFITFNSYTYLFAIYSTISYQPYQNLFLMWYQNRKGDGYDRLKKQMKLSESE